MQNSYSLDSNTNTNVSLNLSDFMTPSTSPQPRKMSELPSSDGLLTTAPAFGRFTSVSPSSSSSTKVQKRIEDMRDLSSQYNIYRCLSPSELNLTQCHEKPGAGGVSAYSTFGSSRFLRRQFSLDRDDCASSHAHKQNLDIPTLHENLTAGSALKLNRMQKQASISVAVDLEKIEESPINGPPHTPNYDNHRNDMAMCRIPGSRHGSLSSHEDVVAPYNNNNKYERREISLNVESLIMR